MRKFIGLTLLASLLCFCNAVCATTSYYIRPAVQYTIVELESSLKSSGKLAPGIAAGCALGSRQAFRLELEGTFTSGLEANGVKDYVGESDTYHEKLNMNQYQFSFKILLPFNDSRVRFFIGPNLGWWTARGTNVVSARYTYSNTVLPTIQYRVAESGFQVGPGAGIVVKISERVKLEAGYRYLIMLGADDTGRSDNGVYGGLVGHTAQQWTVGADIHF